MDKDTTWVGLDVHKKETVVACLSQGARKPDVWSIPTTKRAVTALARKLRKRGGDGEVRCCYEAGPMGYTVQRWLEVSEAGVYCDVIAPSLIPVKPGERIKTDRRDAQKLAEYYRGGGLTVVRPPTEEEESARDLVRCREDAKHDLLRARHRLKKFLLRRGFTWTNGCSWTKAHWEWLRALRFDLRADGIVFDDYLRTVDESQERLKRLDAHVEAMSREKPYREPVAWLRSFRGIDTVIAFTIVAELHGIERFESPRSLMAYLGLTPSEQSSSDKVRRGPITKTGNAHLRRVLMEAAWCQRHRPVVSKALRKRREGVPDSVIRVADKALTRLHDRYVRMHWAGKPPNKVAVAIARELVGFLWAVLTRREETNEDAA